MKNSRSDMDERMMMRGVTERRSGIGGRNKRGLGKFKEWEKEKRIVRRAGVGGEKRMK